MRYVICRYDDATDFLEHLLPSEPGAGDGPGLAFRSPSGLPTGETVRVELIISDPGERHTLHMRVDERNPTLAEDSSVRWKYEATATAEDAPWLEMLVEKLETVRQLGDSFGDQIGV